MKEVIRVVGAVIYNPDTESYFIGQRSKLKKHPLKWEFIGGKVEEENLLEATEREFLEETRRKIKALKLLDTVEYDYGGEVGTVEINFVECEKLEGEVDFDKSVYENCIWVQKNKLLELDWLEADRKFVESLAK